jgi:DnaK suppressor protein
MKEAPEEERFRDLLLNERGRILGFREETRESWRVLQQPERWLQETAQKENLSRSIDQLDRIEKDRVEAIDRALRKIETGSYGFCEKCGDRIDDARLEAVPWAPLCISCAAGGGEPEGFRAVETRGRDLSPDLESMSCEERVTAITEELREDGRIDSQELDLACEGEKVFLRGFLPSEEEHQVLLHILEDRLGLRHIVDEIAINRQLWEREDRTVGMTEDRKAREDETLLQGERENDEVHEAIQEGTPTLAPDELIPEKPE